MVRTTRNVSAALSLFVLAPLVAEFLLGDFPITWLPLLIVLAPTYGGGALLIRESARRAGRGWPTMLLLGAAFALMSEGFVTQSLFNHDYMKAHLHLLDHAYLPTLGVSAWWTLVMLNVHAFWSIGVSIGLVEALAPGEAGSPWLGPAGDGIAAALFMVGMAANAGIQLKQNSFVASHTQLLWTAVACAALIGLAFWLPGRGAGEASGGVPSPWVTGLSVFVMAMLVLLTPPKWGWGACAMILAVDVVFLSLLRLLSRRRGWSAVHTLSVAAGGAIAYGVHAFLQPPVVPGSRVIDRLGNAVFLAAAAGVVAVAAKRSSRAEVRMFDGSNAGG